MTEPWELTAVDALARMRAKELSPVELLASVRARAEQVEPTVNAFTETPVRGVASSPPKRRQSGTRSARTSALSRVSRSR